MIILKKTYVTDREDIMLEWDWELNNKNQIYPNEISGGMKKKIHLICPQKHKYIARVDHRFNNHKCPYCANQKVLKGVNDLKTLCPDIAEEWDYDKNKNLTPNDVVKGSEKKVWWKCKLGHSYMAKIKNRTSGTNCPKCFSEYGTSFAEQSICYYLSKQFKVENRITIEGKEIDIYLPELKIGFEYDGKYFHSSSKSKQQEEEKDKFFAQQKIKVYHIKESNEFKVDGNIIYCIIDRNHLYIEKIMKYIEKILKINSLDVDIQRDRSMIYSRYVLSVKENSFIKSYPHLLEEWDYEKNNGLKPDYFLPKSDKKVWWICSKCKSNYESTVHNRTDGVGCPYCSGKKVNETNSLKNKYPELAITWDYEKNNDLTPDNISCGSKKKVWWICPKCKKSFNAAISKRTVADEYYCPQCMHIRAGKKHSSLVANKNGSITKTNPSLALEWNYEKNNGLIPDNFSYGSGKKVWWKCSKCNYEWEAIIYNRTRGRGCPNCYKKRNNRI